MNRQADRSPLDILTPRLITGVENAPECITLTAVYMGDATMSAVRKGTATWGDIMNSQLTGPHLDQSIQAALGAHTRLAEQGGKPVREDRLAHIMPAIFKLSLVSIETATFELLRGEGGRFRPDASLVLSPTEQSAVSSAIQERQVQSRLSGLFRAAVNGVRHSSSRRLLGDYARAIGRDREFYEFPRPTDSTHAKKTHLYHYLRATVSELMLDNPLNGISTYQTALFAEHILRPY